MSVKKYCYCDNNCKYETMSKEEILAAIANAIQTGTVGECDTGFITTIKTINGNALKFFVGTQAEYAALSKNNKQNLFAIITNDTTKEGLLKAIEELQELHDGLLDGSFVVKKADEAKKLDGFPLSDFRGHDTGFKYKQDFSTTKSLNEYTEEAHLFVMNKDKVDGAPFDAAHGYLDVSHHSGTGFNKSDFKPTIKQVFTAWDTGATYIRIFNGSSWVDWQRINDGGNADKAKLLEGEWITLADTAGYVEFGNTVGRLERATYLVTWVSEGFTHSAIANIDGTGWQGARITWARSKTTVGYIELKTYSVYAYYYQGDSAATEDTITNVRVKRIM